MTSLTDWNRRDFITRTSAIALSSAVVGDIALGADGAAELPTADQFIAGKDRRLLVHSAKTGEIETPLGLLREHAITPKQLLFVRNNQALPGTLTLAAADADDWRIELRGLIESARSITVDELQKLPQREVELVLQCSGNSRSRFAKWVKAEGVPWQHGAMGNVTLRGVSLPAVLDHVGVRIKPTAHFVAAEGRDTPVMADSADFEHSLPLEDALEKSILALSMNGEPIPKVHGGPVRLVTPGYYATMNVKWLNALRFEAGESTNHHHVGRYRTPLKPILPGDKFQSTLDNSEPNWKMRIKSVIFAPLENAKVAAGNVEVRGVAWNDGMAKIESVEVSIDGSDTWRRTQLSRPKSAYAWHHWKTVVQLARGSRTIQARAVDAFGRTQPLDGSIAWNPAGYAWNGVDEVAVDVE